jgi:D-alanine-D-alanine ligase
MRLAQVMHEGLNLRHYSRSDFMISPKGIYFIETNTLPGMTSESLLPKSLAAVGVSFPDFLSHLVDLALHEKKR